MKRTFTRLAAIATVGSALAFAPATNAQPSTGNPAPPAGGGSPAPQTQRICIVNIAKVLRDYNKANFKGADITRRRQAYVTQVQALRDQLAAVNADFQKAGNPDQKKALQEKALGIQRKIEDIDRTAQAELTQLSNDTIVQVYQEIKGVISDIAKTNNLSMVLAYPAATKEAEENSPQVAQLMLQTPALIPFYHRGMDITDVVVQTLNARYPSPPAPPISTVGGTEPPKSPMGTAAPIPGM